MESEKSGPYSLLESRQIYRNPWISVREDRVKQPGGKEGLFGVVEMKPGSTVLALNDAGEVYLVKEYKYAIGRESWELMSGGIEEMETPLDAARRELKEELGLEASQWIDMGVIDPFTTVIHSSNHMFLAMGLKESERSPDEGEILETIRVPFSQAMEMVMTCEITHAASCVLILKAEKHLQNKL